MSWNKKLGGLLLLATVSTAATWHGGWASITVENLPDQLTVGAPYNMTFSIRQHGHDLLSDLNPYLELTSKSGQTKVRAVATNKPGFYTATLNVPEAGEWSINIESSFGRSHQELMPIAAVKSGARAVSFSAAERGQRLFVAKGCTVCHTHAKTEAYGKGQAGPVLTDKRFANEYLREFLANPKIKPPTTNVRMPDLDLSDSEISALASFINAEPPVRTAQKTK